MGSSNDLSSELFQAFDKIVSQKIESLNFNTTLTCTVTDDSQADSGIYKVSDTITTYTAYSDITTYRNGNSVYVLVPNGDYNQQKMIVGSYNTESADTYVYTKPSDRFVNLTENLFSFNEDTTYSLKANDINIKSIVLDTTNIKSGQGYTRLLLRGSFQSWLSGYNLISGEYGLKLDVIDLVSNTTTDSQYKYYTFYLSSADMYGDKYNFNTFYEQEQIFDISGLSNIQQMRLTFYQNGDFKDNDNNLISISPVDNIFLSNPQVLLGQDIEELEPDSALIFSDNGLTYSEYLSATMKKQLGLAENAILTDAQIKEYLNSFNSKKISLRWIESREEETTNGLSVIPIDDELKLPEYATVHWYRYILAQNIIDPIAGAFWQEMIEYQNKFEIPVFIPDNSKQSEQIKVIISYPNQAYIDSLNADAASALADKLKVIAENVNLSEAEKASQSEAAREEHLKIIDENNKLSKIYVSNTLVFNNEQLVPDYAAVDLIKGLTLETDINGYNGVYLIYDENGKLHAQAEASKNRIITANYSSIVTGFDELDTAEKIIWQIPKKNTMIVTPQEGVEYSLETDEFIEYDDYYEIIRYGVAPTAEAGVEEADSTQQYFRIKDYYTQTATNNTILCSLIKNNRIYQASTTLIFGVSGNSGTDYTFIIRFINNLPALIAKEGYSGFVEPKVFDADNKDVTDVFKDFKWSWESKYSGSDSDTISIIDVDGENYKQLYVSTNNIAECQHYILKCQVSGQIELAGKSKSLTLTAYLPIPVRATNYPRLTYDGPTTVVYNTSGTNPIFYNGNCKLYNYVIDGITAQTKEVPSTWQMSFGKDAEDALNAAGAKFYPQISTTGKLTVPSIYIKELGKNISINGYYNKELIWTQPLRVFIDTYSATLINSWDGSLTLDKENGIILSTMVGAGMKDSENRFYGVLLGDIPTATSSDMADGIGLFGYHEGVQSFGWLIDGTGFIGKSGKGQILFDGNSGTIQSSNFKNADTGMKIDLNTGTLVSKYYDGEILLDPTAEDNAYFSIKSLTGKYLLYVGTDDYYLQTNDFTETSGTKIDLSSGKITSYNFTLRSGHIRISNEGTYENPYIGIWGVDPTHRLIEMDDYNYYLQSEDYDTTSQTGMKIDLNGGSITAYDFHLETSNMIISSDGNPTLKIWTTNSEGTKKNLVYINNQAGATDKFYIQSQDYQAENGDTPGSGVRFNLETGKLYAYDFKLKLKAGSNSNYQEGSVLKDHAGSYFLVDSEILGPTDPFFRIHWKTTKTSTIEEGDGSDSAYKGNESLGAISETEESLMDLIKITPSSFYITSSDYQPGGTDAGKGARFIVQPETDSAKAPKIIIYSGVSINGGQTGATDGRIFISGANQYNGVGIQVRYDGSYKTICALRWDGRVYCRGLLVQFSDQCVKYGEDNAASDNYTSRNMFAAGVTAITGAAHGAVSGKTLKLTLKQYQTASIPMGNDTKIRRNGATHTGARLNTDDALMFINCAD